MNKLKNTESAQLWSPRTPKQRLAATMDHEARQLIASAYLRTEECLRDNMDRLERLAEALLQRETLNYDDVEAILG